MRISLYKKYYTHFMVAGTILGIVTGYYSIMPLHKISYYCSKIFVNLLELLSVPLIFLSIVATISGMKSYEDMRIIGKKALKYTLFTTLCAATVGLLLFLIINPVTMVGKVVLHGAAKEPGTISGSYLQFVSNLIPTNFVQLFSNNGNVAGIVLVALLVSFSTLGLPSEQKNFLHQLFASLFAMILHIAQFVILLLPFGVFGFVAEFFFHIKLQQNSVSHLMWYAVCVLLSNVVQGLFVLPLLLWWKGISPLRLFKAVSKALTMAFFSKSSNSTLPVTMSCATENAGISQRVASFVLPLCTTINMNGCAAFMLITVMFVSMSYGITFSYLDMVAWIFMVTAAAIGNAGVPMGCYFLASAFLTSMNVPLFLLGAILPMYTLFDMVETALNVWSDLVVASIVDKELKE